MRWAVASLSNNLYSIWRSIQDARKTQGFASTPATLTVRKIRQSQGQSQGQGQGQGQGLGQSGEGSEEGSGVESPDDRENRSGGGRRKSINKGRKESENGGRKSSLKNTINAGRDGQETGEELEWIKLKGLLPSLTVLLERVQDLFLRDAEAVDEIKRQEQQDKAQAQSSSNSNVLSKVRTSSNAVKKRDSLRSDRSRLSQERGSEGEGPGSGPGSADDGQRYLNYIAQVLPIASECISELLKGTSKRGEDGTRDTTSSSTSSSLSSLLPDYVIRVSEEGVVTSDAHLGPAELYRRRLLNELKYKLVLNVNGKAVTHSDPIEMRHPLLIADFNQFFELRLIHEPSVLSVDVYAVSIGALACLTKGKDTAPLNMIFVLFSLVVMIFLLLVYHYLY